METCCLCKSDVSTGQAKKRRKKLHGTSRNSDEVRSVLIGEVDRKFGVGLEEIAETCSDNSYLCKNCDIKLHKVSELQHQIKQLKLEFELHISSLHLKPSTSRVVSTTASGAKRSGPSLCATTSKRPHLERVQEFDPGNSQQEIPAVFATAHQSPAVTVCKHDYRAPAHT